MQLHILYTLPLLFPDSSTIRLPCSPFVHGSDGIFGFGVSIKPDALELDSRVDCLFLLCDVRNNQVVMHRTPLPYRYLSHLQVIYDDKHATWIVAIDAGIQDDPMQPTRGVVDLYEIPSNSAHGWLHILRVAGSQTTFEERRLITLWQKGRNFLGLVQGYSLGSGITAAYWMQWRSTHIAWHKKIGQGLIFRPYVFDDTFLLFICAYQRKNCQWQWNIASYRTDGSRLSQKRVQGVVYPSRQDEWYYATSDFEEWLRATLFLTSGPYDQVKARSTCVVALFLKDQPEKAISKRVRLAPSGQAVPPSLGGLYWIDQQGKILKYEPGPLGDEICMCLCGEKIIGTDLLDRQRRLWFWSPLYKGTLETYATFPQDVQRVTVVAMDTKDQKHGQYFWCVEEYAEGMRIALWSSSNVQIRQQIWIDGMALLVRHSESSLDVQPGGLVAYQDTLLIVGVNREKHLQVLQIHQE